MKLVEHFNSFLRDTVNLNATRLKQLDESADALKNVIRESDWAPPLITFEEQGSWAHQTIIKPVKGNPFDADLLVVVKPVDGWEAREYLSSLKKVFSDHPTYKDKVTRSSHCVTIEYTGERRVDIAPCIRNRNNISGHEVCNYNTNTFERSEPEEYTNWLRDRNRWSGSNGLKKVTRLLKYSRAIKTTFSCPSVLPTTLLGMQLTISDSDSTDSFSDVPTALRTLIHRLDDWLQVRPTRPRVANPVLSSEDFGQLWTDSQYENFREKINLYRDWIDDAFDEADRDESIGKWRRVFGDEFAADVELEKTASIVQEARALARARGASNVVLDPRGDLVDLVHRFGLSVLPPGFEKRAYKQQPRWRASRHGMFSVRVSATLHASRGGARISEVASGQGLLPKEHWLRFEVREARGSAFGVEKYDVHWRITNTDHEAKVANCLRGRFETSDDGNARWERLFYRGVHMAEAFVVRRNDKMLVAQSRPFYVVIG